MRLAEFPVDVEVARWLAEHRESVVTDVAGALTIAGSTFVMAVVAITVAVIVWRRGQRRWAITVLIAAVVGYAVMVALKHLFARDRPPPDMRVAHLDTFAFPSGHAMMSAVVLGVGVLAMRRAFPSVRRWRWPVVAAAVISLVIGSTRILLGVHWLSDVVAGWGFGLVWVVIVVGVIRPDSPKPALGGSATASHGDSLGDHDRGSG